MRNALLKLAFRFLFPEFKDARERTPHPGHDVYVLSLDQTTKFVHLAQYDPRQDCYYSDGAWFEAAEVTYWAYVPNIENEMTRNPRRTR